jgi:hypothetical protein
VKQKLLTLMCALMLTGGNIFTQQPFVANYDESKVPSYTLPDPLMLEDGRKVESAEAWEERRNEIIKLFEDEVYGRSPAWQGGVHARVTHQKDFLNGQAIMREVTLVLQYRGRELPMQLLMVLPKSKSRVPLFMGYNFGGNQTTTSDTAVTLTRSWVDNHYQGTQDNRATAASRGSAAHRWPFEEIISRGYGVATIHYGDVDPDFDDGFKNGVHQLMGTVADSTSWGSVAAWAWGMSRVMDYLQTVDEIDPRRVIAFGHSRQGKAALWAGATDERFAMVVSNESGCGGAAISRRQFGETVERINSNFPHWFAGNFKKYNRNESMLPVDQHQLLALIAPRPLYVASAEEDQWADPRGEFLACVAASPVYEIHGVRGLSTTHMPQINMPVMRGKIGYHIRDGKHDVTLFDWIQYMNFADRNLKPRL